MHILIKKRVAVIDDDVSIREAVSGIVRSYGFDTIVFESGADFLNSGRIDEAFCAVIDVQMPGLGGLDVQRRLAEDSRKLPLIFMTARPDERVRALAMAGGALGFFAKPVDGDELLRLIEIARAGALA